MTHRFLSIGWEFNHPGIKQDDFFNAPSLTSADAVFIDPERISDRWLHNTLVEKDGRHRTYAQHDRGFGRVLVKVMAKRRAEASDLLCKGGGIIVCRLCPRGEPVEVISQETVPTQVDRYSWLPSLSLVDRQHQLTFPANSRFLARRGKDIVLENTGNPFEDYLRNFEEKAVYHAVYQDLLATPVDHFATVLARNKVGDIVALEIPFGEGRLVLLPSIENVSPSHEATVLIEAVSTAVLRPAFFAEPDWLAAYPLPGEEALRDERLRLNDRKENLTDKIDEISSQLEQVTRYKRLLYTQGRFSLLPAVADSFLTLGFEVEKVGQHLILRSDEGDATCVSEASEQATIDLVPYRQLLRLVDRAHTEEGDATKGILVISGSRELDPKRRPTQFTPQVLRGCKSQGFCLLTTYELFKLVQKVLAKKDSSDTVELRRKLLECDGEFRGAG
jgi:hypothetical protein